ncbi:MAG TPA: ATP phosphoribosyltransferase [Gammaproteobacteria bacterium]|nr:ATP phosphoribosyltransferase [Gammaproteobacteria bacterium]
MTTPRIRIALQKSGRLSEDSFDLLARSGIKVRRHKDQLFCHSENFPIDILLVRDDDIPNLIIEHVCDFGIVGMNVLQEATLGKQTHDYTELVEPIRNLNFGFCRLSIAVPTDYEYDRIESLSDKSIATTYPYLLKKFLVTHKIPAKIIELTGSIEIAPRLGIADAICDLVSTGGTLAANHLKEAETILHSQALLIKSNRALTGEKQRIADLFMRRIQGVLQASESKYIMLHAPKDKLQQIVAILPGVEHPTIMTLDGDPNKVGVHAVCSESVFWETLEKLKDAGASSILVMPVEKMMM